MKTLILNLFVQFLPELLEEIYFKSLRPVIQQFVQQTDNSFDDQVLEALDAFIDALDKECATPNQWLLDSHCAR